MRKTLVSMLVVSMLLVALTAGTAMAAAQATWLVPAKKGPYVVGLSNSFSGNSWRAQMVAEFRAAAEKLKAQGKLKDYVIADATGNTASQIQQIQNMIARKVDAIVIDANSSTALNPVIEKANKAGIVVVSFDSTVDSPYAINVSNDQLEFGRIGAEWLAKKLNGEGNIIVLNGLVGTPVSADRWAGAEKVFKQYPKIKILASVNADWDQAKGQQVVANLLPSMPHIDGIWSQGGAMTLGAMYAFEAAKRPMVPMAGECNNGFFKAWLKYKNQGFDSIAPGNPTFQSVEAMEVALKVLAGESVPHEIMSPPVVVRSDEVEKMVRRDLPDSLWLPTQLDADDLARLFK